MTERSPDLATQSDPLWAGPARSDELRTASVGWPSADLTAAQVDDLELVLDGLLAPGPLELAADAADGWKAGDTVALRDLEGTMIAALRLTSVAPGTSNVQVEGDREGVARPMRWSFSSLRRTPEALRKQFAEDDAVVAVVTDRALHRDDVQDIRAEVAERRAQLLLVQLEHGDAGADATAAVTRALLAVLPELRASTTLTLLPCSRRLLEGDDREDRLDGFARALGAARRLRMGRIGSEIETAIRAGDNVATDATFAAVEAELRAAHPPRHDRGLVVLFTGLSGSGKSTIANALRGRLLERGDRRITLLDGDLVRKHLSKGLGFTPEDRATNVRRIGFVAAEIAHHGGITICAPIGPDAAVRAEIAEMAQRADAGFVLVHVATPLAVCEERDRKGLYAKARAGLISDFTGIDAPYDEPETPDLRLDTTSHDPQKCAQQILDHLVEEGWLTADR